MPSRHRAGKRLNLRLDIPDPKLLVNRISDLLREGIVSGEFPPGEKLIEEELSSILGVSRTPIRQALHILELEGLVELVPRRGAFVAQLGQTDAEELYEILGMIESFAVRQLVANEETELTPLEEILSYTAEQIGKGNLQRIIQANLNFHYKLVETGGNQRLVMIYKTAQNATRLYQSIGLSSQRDWTESLADHRQIVAAIRRSDTETACQLCMEHNRRRCDKTISRLFQRSTQLD